MYTVLRLMRIKWQFSGDKSLGMATVEDRDSAWYCVKPVPRMIQNQLGHMLELNMIDLDRKILTGGGNQFLNFVSRSSLCQSGSTSSVKPALCPSFHMLNELFYRLCYFAVNLLDKSIPLDLLHGVR